MNLKEFAALKPGDRIKGMNGSEGEIVGTTDDGVQIRWDGAQMTYAFTVSSTAWMHWTKLGDEETQEQPS